MPQSNISLCIYCQRGECTQMTPTTLKTPSYQSSFTGTRTRKSHRNPTKLLIRSTTKSTPNPEYDEKFVFDGVSVEMLPESLVRFTVCDQVWMIRESSNIKVYPYPGAKIVDSDLCVVWYAALRTLTPFLVTRFTTNWRFFESSLELSENS